MKTRHPHFLSLSILTKITSAAVRASPSICFNSPMVAARVCTFLSNRFFFTYSSLHTFSSLATRYFPSCRARQALLGVWTSSGVKSPKNRGYGRFLLVTQFEPRNIICYSNYFSLAQYNSFPRRIK